MTLNESPTPDWNDIARSSGPELVRTAFDRGIVEDETFAGVRLDEHRLKGYALEEFLSLKIPPRSYVSEHSNPRTGIDHALRAARYWENPRRHRDQPRCSSWHGLP